MNTCSERWPPEPTEQPMRRIAILRALYLGDLLCAVPAFRALRRRFPTARIDLIGLPWAEDFVERLPYLDRLIEFPGYPGLNEVPLDAGRTAAFFAYLRGKYDLALQMHGDGRASNGFVAALGAKVSVGYARDAAHDLPRDSASSARRFNVGEGYARGAAHELTHSLPWQDNEHEIRRWLRLAAAVGAPSDDLKLEFPIAPHERRAAGELLKAGSGPLIGVHAGSKDPGRRWPAARFAAVAGDLVRQTGASIVLTGTAGERELTAQIVARVPGALDLAGRTDLGLFAAVVERLDLLITNDTGAAHMAAATGTPSVVLFGPGRPAEWGPLDRSRHRVVDALNWSADPQTALQQLPLEPVWREALHSLASTAGVGDAPA